MPVDTGPINSVIQSWLGANQQKLESKRLQQQRDLAEQQLQFEHEQLEQHHEQFSKSLDFQQKMADSALAFAKLDKERQLNEQFGNSNATPTSQLPSPTQNVSTTGDPTNPVNFSNPEPTQQPYKMTAQQGYSGLLQKLFPEGMMIDPNYAKRVGETQAQTIRTTGAAEADVAGQKAKATAEGAFDTQKKLADIENQNKLSQIEKTGNFGIRDAEIRARAEMGAAQIHASAQKFLAQAMHEGLYNPDMAIKAQDSILSGQRDLKDFDKDTQKSVLKAMPPGWLIPEQKVLGTTLQTAGKLSSLLTEYADVIKNFSRDSPGGGLVAASTNGWVAINPKGSDIAARLNNLLAQGGSLASYYDENKRKSDAEILRSVRGIYDPHLTIEQNMHNLMSHVQTLNAGILGTMHGMPSEEINYITKKNGIELLGASNFDTEKPPPTPSTGGQQKVTTKAHIQAYAKQQNITYDKAAAEAIQSGYDIQ